MTDDSLLVGSDLASGVRHCIDYSFSLALYTENQCFPTIYYVLVRYENLGIPLSDTSKYMAKRKPKVYLLIVKLSLSLWLLLRIIFNYYYNFVIN